MEVILSAPHPQQQEGAVNSILRTPSTFLAYCKCAICLDVLYEPVTLACGHTYCGCCLERVQDKRCPQCRKLWFEYPQINVWIWSLIRTELPQHAQRRKEESKRACVEKATCAAANCWNIPPICPQPLEPAGIDLNTCRQREAEYKRKLIENATLKEKEPSLLQDQERRRRMVQLRPNEELIFE